MKLDGRKYVLKAEAPIAILQSRVANQFAKTLDYLPGSVVRGAFAEIFMNKKGSPDEHFQRIFVAEEVRFSDFWPCYGAVAPTLLPATASACKRHKLDHNSSLQDRLLEELLRSESAVKESRKCPECDERLDRLAGVYMIEASPKKTQKVNPHRQLRMHVGISRPRGTATHGLLFSYDMLTAKPQLFREKPPMPLHFIGTLTTEAADAKTLFDTLAHVIPSEHEHLSIGKGRTRGLGEMSILACEPFSSTVDFGERWKVFNEAAQAKGGEQGSCYFSITLTSHLVLKDELGKPILADIQPRHFGLEKFVPIDNEKNFIKFVGKTTLAGWNAAQGLPKPDTVAIARGSVFGFRCAGEKREEAMQYLLDLECSGLGERRAEGFGQFKVCEPFHVKFATGENQ